MWTKWTLFVWSCPSGSSAGNPGEWFSAGERQPGQDGGEAQMVAFQSAGNAVGRALSRSTGGFQTQGDGRIAGKPRQAPSRESAVVASSESNPVADPHPQQSNDGQEEQNNTMEMKNMINNDNREPETAGRSLESQEKSERDNNTKQGDENSPLMARKQLDDSSS